MPIQKLVATTIQQKSLSHPRPTPDRRHIVQAAGKGAGMLKKHHAQGQSIKDLFNIQARKREPCLSPL